MKKYIFLALILFILACFGVYGQTYTYPKYQSGHDIAEWVMRGGHIASGSYEPTGTASEGALFYDVATPSKPILYRYTSGTWAIAGGAGTGTTATITEAIEANSASITLNTNAIATVSNDLAEHIADQIDPHGATMTISQELTIGEGVPDASVSYNGTGTIKIASYVQIPFESVEPTTTGTDTITFWADPASNTIKAFIGTQTETISIVGGYAQMNASGAAAVSIGTTYTKYTGWNMAVLNYGYCSADIASDCIKLNRSGYYKITVSICGSSDLSTKYRGAIFLDNIEQDIQAECTISSTDACMVLSGIVYCATDTSNIELDLRLKQSGVSSANYTVDYATFDVSFIAPK